MPLEVLRDELLTGKVTLEKQIEIHAGILKFTLERLATLGKEVESLKRSAVTTQGKAFDDNITPMDQQAAVILDKLETIEHQNQAAIVDKLNAVMVELDTIERLQVIAATRRPSTRTTAQGKKDMTEAAPGKKDPEDAMRDLMNETRGQPFFEGQLALFIKSYAFR
ncbi:hypothetical protein H2201_005235 [Coniosporium apollinis]|uniref:Uncharacterized protein n=1 Tax=Coniosporium apollinis TaxID=61459 RepID=A0ABQ9NS38_9PEZI|nr:hypothetical protein H2201_005235 [Coniosporium apollinis]